MSGRVVPLLALILLETPLSWVGLICHEEGHGLVALAQGGTFTGIVLTQTVSYALAYSYLVSIGGWVGDYALAIVALLLYWRIKPKSFLGRSVLAVLIVQNLTNEPPYIASLQGDSLGTLGVLEATGIGKLSSTAVLEATALVLGLVGVYCAWRIFRTYFSSVFSWISSRRASWASLIFVVGSAAYTWFGYFTPSESSLTNNLLVQLVPYVGFLVVFAFLVIPPAPEGTPKVPAGGPAIATVVFIVLLFVEAQIVFFFAMPATIPFP
ncbi:MAG TPA: hypothetical protein VEC08_02535 [Nitrososphaerales archaeon]|nr:hypothetical protein [Nitrososphaerales archaeon]